MLTQKLCKEIIENCKCLLLCHAIPHVSCLRGATITSFLCILLGMLYVYTSICIHMCVYVYMHI